MQNLLLQACSFFLHKQDKSGSEEIIFILCVIVQKEQHLTINTTSPNLVLKAVNF